jgi:SAM-dependent methyltransferase
VSGGGRDGSRFAAALEERLALMAPSRRLRLALADEILNGFAAGRSIRVLDAGTSDGLLALALARRHPHWSLLGVDLRENLLEGARTRARARGLGNVEFERADLTRPLPASGFDAVLALESLHEIPDDLRALEMMAAALAPDGIFVLQVPERDWKPVLSGSPATWRDQVRQGYGAEEITRAIERAGLEMLELRPTYRSAVTAAQEVRDRIKGRSLALRAAAFPVLAAAVRLERWGLTGGRANALLAVARPAADGFEAAHLT